MSSFTLPYTFAEIPVEKIFDIDGVEFIYRIEFADFYDYFTLTVLDLNRTILYTSKMVYEGDALHAGKDILKLVSDIRPQRIDSSDTLVFDQASFSEINITQIEP